MFFKKAKEYNKLAKGFNGAYAMINEVELKINEDEYQLEQDLFIIAYIIRREVLDRIEKYNWHMNTPIIIPLMSRSRVTLNFAIQQTVLRLHKISEILNIQDVIIAILDKDDAYYEIEKEIPSHMLNIIF